MSGDAPAEGELVLATWNVHGCKGRDRRERPERTAAVIAELGADVVALQEVWCRAAPDGSCTQPALLAGLAGFSCLLGPTLRRGDAHYGNVLLLRRPARRVALVDISSPRREPRGAIDVTLDVGGRDVRVIATHLGLDLGERRRQVDQLLALIDASSPETTADGPAALAVLGDFNDWLPGRSAAHALDRRLGRCVRLPTWPCRRPLLPLDRIWVDPCQALVGVRVHDTPSARVASDHLPLVGTLRLDGRGSLHREGS